MASPFVIPSEVERSLEEIRGPDASFPKQNQDTSDNRQNIEQKNGRP